MGRETIRWRKAQEYERKWWGGYAGDYGWYREFSREIIEMVNPFRAIAREMKILEIGSGPAGGITYLDADHKYAIEPLESYFCTLPEVLALRDPRVCYIQGRGEELPFEQDFFDLIIIDNVLDHCENPSKVFDEMDRVLKQGGLVFFRQNVYSLWGHLFRRFMETLQIDRGHPHTFGRSDLERHFSQRSWGVHLIRSKGSVNAWLAGLTSGNLKRIVKSALFVNSDRVTWVLEKKK